MRDLQKGFSTELYRIFRASDGIHNTKVKTTTFFRCVGRLLEFFSRTCVQKQSKQKYTQDVKMSKDSERYFANPYLHQNLKVTRMPNDQFKAKGKSTTFLC